MVTPAVAATRPRVTALPRIRLDSVDLVRGFVMVVMALDHVRAYFTIARFDPTDLSQTTAALFATRWLTHFCAPVFVLLAGASAWMAGRRRTRGELSWFLATRGAWLVLLEFTVVSFGWYFTPDFRAGAFAQVIWAIGVSMVVLAALVWLPRTAIAAAGIVLIAGHNLLDGVTAAPLGVPEWLWTALHAQAPLGVLPIMVMYPLLPWIGVMAAGYALGPVLELPPDRRTRALVLAGAALTAGFVVVRAINLYGDPTPWSVQRDGIFTALSFLNTTKYPPSLDFLLMTLGPALMALGLVDRARGALADFFVSFGWVPLFYYVLHLYVVHALAIAVGVARGVPARDLATVWIFYPEGWGFGLGAVYLIWAGVVIALYPACRWFAGVKRRQAGRWWVSYV